MNIANEIKAKEAKEFLRKNGVVMRIMLTLFPRGFFNIEELLGALAAYKDMSIDDVLASIDYFADKGYIDVRHIETRETVLACDYDADEIEMRVRAEGVLIGKNIIEDIGIEL